MGSWECLGRPRTDLLALAKLLAGGIASPIILVVEILTVQGIYI